MLTSTLKRATTALALCATSAAAAIAVPEVADASVCTTQYCGGVVYNGSSVFSIRITNQWCWSDQIRYYQNDLPCTAGHRNDPDSYNADYELPLRDGSQYYFYYYDTDAFRVYANCAVNWTEAGSTVRVDRHGRSSEWIKISNGERITITDISCG